MVAFVPAQKDADGLDLMAGIVGGVAEVIGEEDQGDQQGQPTPSGISPQEQQQMLDAIQAQEDKTQEKLKEKAGVVVRGNKNW